MNKDVKFRRNVYIILVCVLLLAIATQIARSKFVLEFSHNGSLQEKYQTIKQNYLASGKKKPDLSEPSNRNYCLLFDGHDELSIGIKNNTEQVLNYMKQPHSTVDLTDGDVDFEQCQAVLMTASLQLLNDEVKEIENYVSNGGYMFIMRLDDPTDTFIQIYRKLGFVSFAYLVGDTGISLTSNVLVNQSGVSYKENFIYNNVLAGEIEKDVLLMARTGQNYPLMWKKQYGSGAFLVFNGSSLDTKDTRGLIAGGISMLEPDYIYPIFNTKLFYMDDFPAPIPQGINDTIYAEYQRETPVFFHEIWWPQMIKAAKLHDIKYTAVAIQTYQDNVHAPFVPLDDEELHNLIGYGREVIKSGGEIGIHGYNHQSLQMNKEVADFFEYKIWDSQEDMEASVKTVLNYIARAFPKYAVMSYVPPSNVLGAEGRQALVNAWPELAVISSLYMVDPSNRAYVQEFEIADDGIIEMPRVTSGYFDTEYNKWVEANTITSIGVFSHFIHPDDLLDEDRGRQQKWKDLYRDFEHLLERLHTTYPWLRSITSAEAAIGVAHQLQSNMDVIKNNKELKVKTTSEAESQYFIFRTDKKIGKLVNCSVRKIDTDTYLVTAFKQDFTIGLGR